MLAACVAGDSPNCYKTCMCYLFDQMADAAVAAAKKHAYTSSSMRNMCGDALYKELVLPLVPRWVFEYHSRHIDECEPVLKEDC